MGFGLTNANKGAIIIAVNAVLALLVGFGVPITNEQTGLIGGAVNALLGVWLAFTYEDSPKRLPKGVKDEDVQMYVLNVPEDEEVIEDMDIRGDDEFGV